MQKIPTLFKRDPEDRRHVLPEVTPGCEWVLDGEGTATRKYDGTCVMLDEHGQWWARREVKPGKTPPPNFAIMGHDEITGKTVGWEPIEQSGFVKFFNEALALFHYGYNTIEPRPPGTYELIGPKINGNPERLNEHYLVRHGSLKFNESPRTFETLRAYLTDPEFTYEGIVWHHPDGRMAKLKRRDFQ